MEEFDDAFVQGFGFTDTAEFHHLVAAVRLSEPGALERFKKWQYGDGTRDALLEAFPYLRKALAERKEED